ncbi:MAG: NPXTG-anchored protein, partial [Ruminococcus sp.]|nr:NPXTG-anchored protein [Ruminococcus sp.]
KLEFSFAPSAVNPNGDEEVGDIGIQVFIDGAEEGQTYTADVKYTVTGLTGTTENSESNPESEAAKCPCGCSCTAETCKNWNAEKNQCDCGCCEAVSFTPRLLFADGSWSVNTMDEETFTEAPVTVETLGNGTYTLKLDTAVLYPTMEDYAFNGATVFVVDIPEVYEMGYNKKGEEADPGIYNKNGEKWSDDIQRQLVYPNFKAVLDKITVDGKEIAFDAAKIVYGDIENQNTNYRIEIYNEYGDTKEDAPLKTADLAGKVLEVTFTIDGLDSKPCTCETTDNSTSSSDVSSESSSETSTDSKDTSSSSKATNNASGTNPGTGTAALAVVGIALAGAAAVTAKKRK